MDANDFTEELIAAKEAEARARMGLEERLLAIKEEKKKAHAGWKAEENQIHELLRVRPKTSRPRKPKPVIVPALERAEQK